MSEVMTYALNWFRLNSSWTNKNGAITVTPSIERAIKSINVTGLPNGAVIESAILNVSCSSGYGGPRVLTVNGISLTGNAQNHIDFSSSVVGNGEQTFTFIFQDYGVDNLSDGKHYGEMVFSDIALVVTYSGQPPSEEPEPADDTIYPDSDGLCLFAADEVDFSSNGLGVLTPLSCDISEEAGGAYELKMVMAADGDELAEYNALGEGVASGALWRMIAPDCVIRAPVPVITTEAFTAVGAEYWKIKATYADIPVKSKIPTVRRVSDSGSYPAWSRTTRYQRGAKVSYQGKVWQYTGVVYPRPDGTVIGALTEAPGSAGYWVDVTSYSTKENSGETLAKLGRNEIFTRIDVSGDWMRIKTGSGVEGYIESKYAEYYSEGGSSIETRTIRSQLFRVYAITKDSKTMRMTVQARHISYDYTNTVLGQCQAQGVTAATALSLIRGAALQEDNRQLVTNIDGGSVDLSCSWENGVSALLNQDTGVVSQLQAKLIRDNYDFFVLRDDHTDRGYSIDFGRNMKSVKWSIDLTNLATRIVPHCKDADGNPLLMRRQYLDSPYINDYAVPHVEPLDVNAQVGKKGTYRGTEYEELTEEQCRFLMLDEAQKRFDIDHADEPEITIDVDMVMLRSTDEYKDAVFLEELYMYDAVRVRNPRLKIDTTAYIRGYQFDALLRRYTKLTLTNARRRDDVSVTGSELRNNSIKIEKLSASAIDRLRS